ncbi:hypothetical protein [Hoeflea sp.]|uniref:hypothetical protein n=1 Tax=Hoeflea sp. TaxID=1940281 RepID=UPI003BAEE840
MVALAVSIVGTASCPAGAQDQLSQAEKDRLAASDGGVVVGGETILREIGLPFHDPFDGAELSDSWSVINRNADKYVVEGGAIFALESGGKTHPKNPDADNLYVVEGLMPNTDFDMSVKAKLDAKTGYEDVWVGLRADDTNYLAANISVYSKGCGASLYLSIENRRTLSAEDKPQETSFTSNLLDGPIIGNICNKSGRALGDTIISSMNTDGFTLTLSRRGYRYKASIELEIPPEAGDTGTAQRATYSTSSVSRVAAFGQPFFMLGQSSKAGNGETTVLFEDFTISAAE